MSEKEGAWVKDAKANGWWDNPQFLKSYLVDMEHDLRNCTSEGLGKGNLLELADDIHAVRDRITKLT